MKILLTNDDGYNSPGIQILRDRLQENHDVWIVAPDTNRSGVSHSITLRTPVKISKKDEQVFACSGTPVDCIILVHHGILPMKPDLVISGINIGPNLGSDLFFSGTAAGARQAAWKGYPALAVSIDTFTEPYHFRWPVAFIEENLERFVEMWTQDFFWNINFPNREELPGKIEISQPAKLEYNSTMERFVAPTGDIYHFYQGSISDTPPDDNSDWAAVRRGNVSISPINLLQSFYGSEESLSPSVFDLPAP